MTGLLLCPQGWRLLLVEQMGRRIQVRFASFPQCHSFHPQASTAREAFSGLAPTLSPSCEHLVGSMKKSLQVGTNSHYVCGSRGFCVLMLDHTKLLAVHYIFRWLLTSLCEAWCLPQEAVFASCLSLEEPIFPFISGHLVALWPLLSDGFQKG